MFIFTEPVSYTHLMIGGSWDTAVLEESAEFDWGVTYYPVNDDTKEAVSPCGDWAAAVSKDCENPEAAGKFLQWLMNTDNVASYAAAIAKPATRISAYDTEEMAEYKEGVRAVFKAVSYTHLFLLETDL